MNELDIILAAAQQNGINVDRATVAAALQSQPFEVVLQNVLRSGGVNLTPQAPAQAAGPAPAPSFLGQGNPDAGIPQPARLSPTRLGGADSGDTIGSYPGMGQAAFASDPYAAKGAGATPQSNGSGQPRLIPLPGTQLLVWANPDGTYLTNNNGEPLTITAQQAGGGGAGQPRMLFDEERALLTAQTQSAQAGDVLARDKFAQDKIDSMNKFGLDLRRLGLDEQAFKAEDAARLMTQQYQQAQLQQQAQQNKLSAIMGAGQLDLGFQQANADYQARVAELGLKRDQATREILRNPSDVLARLFFQRGGTSPTPLVSHADLINRLSTEIPNPTAPTNPMSKYQSLLDSILNAPPPTFGQPSPAAMLTPQAAAPAAAANPYAAINAIAAQQGASGTNFSGLNAAANASPGGSPQDSGVGGYSSGGSTTDRVLLGNEQGAELIMNPEGAPLTIVDAPTTKKVLKKSKLSPPGYALGTISNFGYNQALGTTQDELLGLARQGTAPGPAALLGGGQAPKLDLPGLPLPSAQQFGRLTGDERESLRPRLGVEFQTSLEDLTDMLKLRYGGTRSTPTARLGIR